jgi:hypothetical protein
VAADIEEGAVVTEAVLEVGQVVVDAVEVPNLQTRPEATFSPSADEVPSRNLTPLAAALCPTVGANCRGNLETLAMGRLIVGARRWRRGARLGIMPTETPWYTQVQGPPGWR